MSLLKQTPQHRKLKYFKSKAKAVGGLILPVIQLMSWIRKLFKSAASPLNKYQHSNIVNAIRSCSVLEFPHIPNAAFLSYWELGVSELTVLNINCNSLWSQISHSESQEILISELNFQNRMAALCLNKKLYFYTVYYNKHNSRFISIRIGLPTCTSCTLDINPWNLTSEANGPSINIL